MQAQCKKNMSILPRHPLIIGNSFLPQARNMGHITLQHIPHQQTTASICNYDFFYVHFACAIQETDHDTTTMLISRKIEIDYGHTLPNSYSFCNQLHGHRGVVVATVEGPLVNRPGDGEEGMVMDFKFLHRLMIELIHDQLDHGFAVWKNDDEDLDFILRRNQRVLVTDTPPTAECLAMWAFRQLAGHLPEGVTLKQIRWYETPNNWADYTGQ